jgi:dCTP deaminase
MIANQGDLIAAKPISPMYLSKQKANGVSFGLSEAGYDIRIKQSLILHPLRRFRLASTIEKFTMPDNLVGIVHDKSTWARRGLSVFNTIIEPGWKGYLTLELVYHGWKPLHIKAGSGIAQVVFHQITCPIEYTGRYQDQADMPVAAKELK